METSRITIRPDMLGGAPCVRGLRIPVRTVVGMVTEGMSERDILSAYPDLTGEDIRACLEYDRANPSQVTDHEVPDRQQRFPAHGGGIEEGRA